MRWIFGKTLSIVLLLSLLAATLSACKSSDDTATRSPNFVVILTDDQGASTMDYMPILKRELIANGINFTHGYVTTPLCCPSRASIYSGQYAHTHGVLDNRLPLGGALRFDDTSTIATWLDQAGYRTIFLGKYLNEYDNLEPAGYIPPGWDEWFVFFRGTRPHRYYQDYDLAENGEINHYGTSRADFSTDALAQRAVDFITSNKDTPFFLVYAPYAPHQPHEFADRHRNLYRDDKEIIDSVPPSFFEEDISDKPAWMQSLPASDPEQAISVYQRSLRSIQSVDEAIGKITHALDRIGQRENTLIIFLSDNGLTYGEHRLVGQKNCQFEECLRVPFVISYPAAIKTPRDDDHLVLNIDLAPTIAEIAGVKAPDSVDGSSLVPLFTNDAASWREAALFEHWRLIEGFGSMIPDFTAIRSGPWKYVEYGSGERELYNLEKDPYEMQNLAALVDHQAILGDLAARLEALRQSTGFDPLLRDRLINQLTPEGYPTAPALPEE